MSSFVITTPAATPEESAIVSGPFWPDISPSAIRDEQRIDTTIPPVRLRAVIIEAIATTNGALRAWRESQQDSGIATLAAVTAETIDDESILIHRYRRAVGCLTKALILERLPDYDATAKGDKRADAQASPIEDCRRDHLAALADIQGKPRCIVELI